MRPVKGIGPSGPDAGKRSKYLLVPPGCNVGKHCKTLVMWTLMAQR